jgi:hypothetical protein
MTFSFHQQRRQQFLTEAYGATLSDFWAGSQKFWFEHVPEADSVAEARSLAAASVADDAYKLLSLRYTAGISLEQLRIELTHVVDATERYQKALGEYEQSPQMSPLGLDQLADYERAMQIISLCILLRRPDLLRRMAALIDPGYKGEDTLYEDLMAFYEPGRIELDEWYHEKPYTTLVQAMYEEDSIEASKKLKAYCGQWYASFKHVAWHDGHLRIDGTDGDYFGYWAFEAGAVALLYEIDDSAISHMVYPKDLVEWARSHADDDFDGGAWDGERTSQSNVPGGQPCPKAGWWFTPATANSRRYFQAGEVMPIIEGSRYGATFWQWDVDQSSPKL